MRAALSWRDFEIIDATDGERLERWGDVLLIRPDPQVLWKTVQSDPRWKLAHGRYHRSKKGGGEWEWYKKVDGFWTINYLLQNDRVGDNSVNLAFNVKPMGFKHTGIFPEQAVNWDYIFSKISDAKRRQPDGEIRVLNLFGYTGAATLAGVAAGAHVTHVDAAKGMVAWGRENAEISGLRDKPMRWIVDDCTKFIHREIRRGNKYHAIIMDPPSYGRGPSGEIWKIEDSIFDLIKLCVEILDENSLFLLVNSYTAGLSPSVMQYMLGVVVAKRFGGTASSGEIGLKVNTTGMILPCGSSAIWER